MRFFNRLYILWAGKGAKLFLRSSPGFLNRKGGPLYFIVKGIKNESIEGEGLNRVNCLYGYALMCVVVTDKLLIYYMLLSYSNTCKL